ncbi:MAG: hypothetical protein ACYTFK_13975, partial [Planctomycetota bacterium]
YGNGVDTWDDKTKSQYEAQYLLNGKNNLWIKKVDDNISEAAQYLLDREFTPAEVLRNEKYFGGTSAAQRDVSGDLITDINGFVVFHA